MGVWLVAGVLIGALALRLWLSARLALESDEAIVGLMARHILEGERPVFYYGQVYMGALEAYLVALAFAVLGPSVFAMRLVTIALSVVFCYLVYQLGSRLRDRRVGLASALYVGVSPVFLTIWSVKVRGGYVETLVAGTAMLVLLHDVTLRGRRETWRLAILGLVAGLAAWADQLILPYLIVVAVFVVFRLGRKSARVIAIAAPAFAAGSSPLWLWNARNSFETFTGLAQSNSAGVAGLLDLPGNLARVIVISMPTLLGFVPPTTDLGLLREMRSAQAGAYAAGALATVGLAALGAHWLLTDRLARAPALIARPEAPLALLLVITPILFALSQTAPLLWGEPRYLVPMYSAVPFFAAYLSRPVGRPYLAAVVLLGVLSLNAWGNVSALGSHPVATYPDPVVRQLVQRGDTRLYGDYWLVYVLAFESGERIRAAVIEQSFGSGVRLADNRYEPYVAEVSAAASQAFVFPAGSESDPAFARYLDGEGIGYSRTKLGGVVVYDDLRPTVKVLGRRQ